MVALSAQESSSIKRLGLCWLYVESYPERVWRFPGDNRGAWPSRLKGTSKGPYTALRKTINEDPVHERHVFRAWGLQSDEHARRVVRRVGQFFQEHDVAMRGVWHDMEPARMAELIEWAAMVIGIELLTESEFWLRVSADIARKEKKDRAA